MTNIRVDAFFYGLFMDSTVLRASDVTPVEPRPAFVDDYALCIGRRATLVATPGARAYGMVFALTQRDLDALYAAPGLQDYRAEHVVAQTTAGTPVPAVCYTLPTAPEPEEANAAYAARLRAVVKKLGFPAEYVATIV